VRKEFKRPDRSNPGVVDQPVQTVLGLLRYSVERLLYRRSVRQVHNYGGDTVSLFTLQSALRYGYRALYAMATERFTLWLQSALRYGYESSVAPS
jgi:hypothetical protein